MLTYAVVAEKPANSDADAQNSAPKPDRPQRAVRLSKAAARF